MAIFALASGSGHVVVDCSDSVSYTRRINNPILIIPVPTSSSKPAGSYTINLTMMSDIINLSFTCRDGWGDMNYTTPGSTKIEKLLYLSKMKGDGLAKILRVDGATSTTYTTVQIISASFSTPGGQKDIIKVDMVLQVTN